MQNDESPGRSPNRMGSIKTNPKQTYEGRNPKPTAAAVIIAAPAPTAIAAGTQRHDLRGRLMAMNTTTVEGNLPEASLAEATALALADVEFTLGLDLADQLRLTPQSIADAFEHAGYAIPGPDDAVSPSSRPGTRNSRRGKTKSRVGHSAANQSFGNDTNNNENFRLGN